MHFFGKIGLVMVQPILFFMLIMVNPYDGANATRNETKEILPVYLMNRSYYIGGIRIKMIYCRIKKKLEGKWQGQ